MEIRLATLNDIPAMQVTGALSSTGSMTKRDESYGC
jgi:hypothetical protein